MATKLRVEQLDIEGILKKVYPVGSLYFNGSADTNPNTILGFGTWTLFGAGRVPVCINSSDTDFDTIGETRGAKTHTLTTNEMPSHTHTQNAHSHIVYGHYTGRGTGENINPMSSTTGFNVNTTSVTATNQNSGGVIHIIISSLLSFVQFGLGLLKLSLAII